MYTEHFKTNFLWPKCCTWNNSEEKIVPDITIRRGTKPPDFIYWWSELKSNSTERKLNRCSHLQKPLEWALSKTKTPGQPWKNWKNWAVHAAVSKVSKSCFSRNAPEIVEHFIAKPTATMSPWRDHGKFNEHSLCDQQRDQNGSQRDHWEILQRPIFGRRWVSGHCHQSDYQRNNRTWIHVPS